MVFFARISTARFAPSLLTFFMIHPLRPLHSCSPYLLACYIPRKKLIAPCIHAARDDDDPEEATNPAPIPGPSDGETEPHAEVAHEGDLNSPRPCKGQTQQQFFMPALRKMVLYLSN
ncbi:hypothetical protein BP00DRAFT_431717 [Aspergillus indologenus CBS 114.80]|uniref:Uncharacterized protein n=1 Tax=Aspergillus indologenus CBS 114.80 TaxID=1450541 RepID=A0A2V5HKH4_9EURO|nr:hypothetical protein BP00DRAFT_431717 [Aspergillus indologenus CBS 114.80]